MIKRHLIAGTAFVLCFWCANPAMAIEGLRFHKEIKPSLLLKFDSIQDSINISNYDIADIDLNNDGFDEHILKEKQCSSEKKQCQYLIIAEKNDKILILSTIEARNIVAGGTYSHGVKDILAFDNEINDYNFDIYMWSPNEKAYILKDQ